MFVFHICRQIKIFYLRLITIRHVILVKDAWVLLSTCRYILEYALDQGRIQDFKLGGGGALKKIAPSRGRHEIFGVFRVKNHDFTPKNLTFFNCRGRRENF